MREIQVNLAAIKHNYLELKKIAAPAKVMAVVKANAYGHGAHEVAHALEEINVDALGVADFEEAVSLRLAGIKTSLMCWILDENTDFQLAKEMDIQLGISTMGSLVKAIEEGNQIHIKVDTGLGRNGFTQSDWDAVFTKLAGRSIGLFSHLANTSLEEDRKQQQLFEKALAHATSLGVTVHTAHLTATAGTLSYPDMQYDMVRCGIGVYGLNPWDDRELGEIDLLPAMRVVASVVNVKRVPKGQGVSYGYRYVTDKDTTLALVPFGYGEGMPRIAVGAKVLIGGKMFEISGRIAMDQFVVDVGDFDVKIGDDVVIFGNPAEGEPTAEALGAASGSINYEVVTRIGGRAKRVYLER
jgi:alanine racemase